MFKKSLIAGTAFVAIAIGATPSMAQDWQAAPTFGHASLQAGFSDDPRVLNLAAGGSIYAPDAIGEACHGYIANAPDFNLTYIASPGTPLAISVSSDEDTTLVISGPNGEWFCDDDSGQGTNPSAVFANPETGLYNIWVGTFSPEHAAAALGISEVSSF